MERAVGPRLAERLAAPRQGSRGGDGQSEEGNAEGAQQEAGSCRACPDAKAKGSPFCGKHKRAFQCIQGRCCKKNKEGFYVDPDAAADFHKIFGEGRNPPPNVTLANEVVLDFCIDNPDGKETSGKKRGGQLNLNKYVNRVYASLSQGRLEDDCLWDEEIFVNKFRSGDGAKNTRALSSCSCSMTRLFTKTREDSAVLPGKLESRERWSELPSRQEFQTRTAAKLWQSWTVDFSSVMFPA